MKNYGKSVSIDLHGCNADFFTRKYLRNFVKALCVEIDMTPAKLVWWDYGTDDEAKAEAPAHLKGVSLVQFIETSTIVVHTLDDLGAVYLDLFSCKDFNTLKVGQFAKDYFQGEVVTLNTVERK